MRRRWLAHKLRWNLSGGRLGRTTIGMPVLELVTTGRKSGEPRQVLITYVESDGWPAIVGTNAGKDADPAWVLNLRADPNARARWDGRWHDVVGVELDGDAWQAAWDAAAAAHHGYAEYAEGLTRRVPIMRLEDRAP